MKKIFNKNTFDEADTSKCYAGFFNNKFGFITQSEYKSYFKFIPYNSSITDGGKHHSFKFIGDNLQAFIERLISHNAIIYQFDNSNEMFKWLIEESEKELPIWEILNLPNSYEELKTISGEYINSNGAIIPTKNIYAIEENKSVFATRKQAESALAFAQLTQLMKVYNDDWKPNWNDSDEIKYCIIRENNTLIKNTGYCLYQAFAFKTNDLRDKFLSNFESLLKTYFMIEND